MLLTLALLLIGVLSGLYALTCWRAYRAEQSYPPAGQFVVVNGLRLHYVRQGNGPSVVLLHGSEGFWQDFKAVIELLAGQYDVIAFDRPGHGYSDAPRASDCAPDAQAALIHDALLQMGVSRPLLVGHSWSGTLMLAYALMYPQEVTGLTLLGGWVYAPETLPLWLLRIPAIPLLGPLAVATLLLVVKGHYLRQVLDGVCARPGSSRLCPPGVRAVAAPPRASPGVCARKPAGPPRDARAQSTLRANTGSGCYRHGRQRSGRVGAGTCVPSAYRLAPFHADGSAPRRP